MDVYFLTEDALSDSVAVRLIGDKLGDLTPVRLGSGGGWSRVQKSFLRANNLAEHEIVLAMIDLDNRECIFRWRNDFLAGASIRGDLAEFMNFSISKREIESWLIADTRNFAAWLGISEARIDPNAEETTLDPKDYLLRLVRRSKRREVRDQILPRGEAKVGIGYNGALSAFVRERWEPDLARVRNQTLDRLLSKLEALTS